MKVGFAERDITPDLEADRREGPGYSRPDTVHDPCKVRAVGHAAFPFTYIVEMANGCVGYTPPEEEFGEHGGGLETRLSDYRNLEPGACRCIFDASIRLADSLTPGDVPEPEKAGPGRPFCTTPPELE